MSAAEVLYDYPTPEPVRVAVPEERVGEGGVIPTLTFVIGAPGAFVTSVVSLWMCMMIAQGFVLWPLLTIAALCGTYATAMGLLWAAGE